MSFENIVAIAKKNALVKFENKKQKLKKSLHQVFQKIEQTRLKINEYTLLAFQKLI